MVTDENGRRDHPFGGFTVMTEAMPDGRQIHYYEWAAPGPDVEAARPGGGIDQPPTAPPGPDEGTPG